MSQPDLVVRPATASDVRYFYPDMSCSFRAWVADLDARPVGIVGVALARPVASLFSTFDEALRPFLKTMPVMRAIKKAALAMAETRLPVLAIAEPSEPTAPGLLKRMGFEYYDTSEDGEVYRWARR